MALTARDRSRYARHLLLPQIGEAGQERLLAARIGASADADGAALEVARVYLERAGLRVDGAEGGHGRPRLELAASAQVERIAGDPALLHAARTLAGALGALHALAAVAGFSAAGPQTIPSLSVLAEDA